MICDKDDVNKLLWLQQAVHFVQSNLTYFVNIKPVILFLKKLLSNYGLLDTYVGGLNSYSIMIMLVCVASQMISVNTPPTSADYLKEFLNCYKTIETFRNFVITKNGFVERKQNEDVSVFFVQDPNDPSNNTSKSCF